MSQVAFVDESYIDRTAHYLLAAAVLPEVELSDVRLAIAQLRRQHGAAFHWHDEHELARLAMLAAALADTTTRAVVVAQPVSEHRQERARATCMAHLLAHPQTLEPTVARVVFESRTKALNRPRRVEGRGDRRGRGRRTAGRVVTSVSGSGRDTRIEAHVDVTNTGDRTGSEVVQLYVGDPESAVQRPRELKGFTKLTPDPGETRTAPFTLTARDLSYWHPSPRRWAIESGAFVIEVGASPRDVRGTVTVDVAGEELRGELDGESTVAEWRAHLEGAQLLADAPAAGPAIEGALESMIDEMPVRLLASFDLEGLSRDALDTLIARVAGT